MNDSRRLPDVHLNFIRSHPLMDSAVPALHGQPLLMRTSLHQRFTKITVDPQVRAADGTLYDVLFIATGQSRVGVQTMGSWNLPETAAAVVYLVCLFKSQFVKICRTYIYRC